MKTYCDNGKIYFYDKNIKSWTIYSHDENGNQVGESEYCNDKKQLKKEFPKLKFIPIEEVKFEEPYNPLDDCDPPEAFGRINGRYSPPKK